MKTGWLHAVALSIAVAAASATVSAHHSFAAEFDVTKSVTLTGTVVKLQWTNPHAHIHVDVKDEGGAVTSWDFELGSPNALMRRGWSARSLKAGDAITVSGYAARDGSRLANARSVTMSDGRKMFAGSSAEAESNQ